MTELEGNKQLLRDLLSEIDRRNLASLEEFYHREFVEHSGSLRSATPGIETVRAGLAAFMRAFDDYHHTVDDLVAEGDRVAARVTFSGVFARPLFRLAPTGQRVTATSVAIYRFAQGRIQEKWGYFNALEFLGQSSPRG